MLAKQNKNKMKKPKNRFLQQLVDLIERELIAVIAVAVVLAFIFSQSLATAPGDEYEDIVVRSSEGVSVQQDAVAGLALINGSPTINFGQDITGKNSTLENWTIASGINFGDRLYLADVTQVTISNINPGTYNLYVTGGGGTTIVNGTPFAFGPNQTTLSGTVSTSNGTLIVKFPAGATIWKISTVGPGLADGTTSGGSGTSISIVQTPSILSVVPGSSKLSLGAVLTPLVVVQDQYGKVMPTPPTTWTTSDPEVATVDASGTVTAVGTAGGATITVTVVGTNLKASLSIEVPSGPAEAPPVIDVTPPEATVDEEGLLDEFVGDFIDSWLPESEQELTLDEADENILDTIFGPDAVGEIEEEVVAEEPTTGGDIDADLVLDAYAKAVSEQYAERQTTTLNQREINRVLDDTSTTALNRIATSITLTVNDAVKTFGEILTGSQTTVKTPDGDVVVKKPSIFEIIGNWIKINLLGGASATTMGSATHTEGDIN